MIRYDIKKYYFQFCLGFGFWVAFKKTQIPGAEYVDGFYKTCTYFNNVLTVYIPFFVISLNFRKTIFNEKQ